jgi:hypothetical protein
MSKFNLDLSKFKKSKADENTSTLLHPDGHQITIAHKGLSAKLKKQLSDIPTEQKFSDGGVTKINTGNPNEMELPPDTPQTPKDEKFSGIPNVLSPDYWAGQSSPDSRSIPEQKPDYSYGTNSDFDKMGTAVASNAPISEDVNRLPAMQQASPQTSDVTQAPAPMNQDPYGIQAYGQQQLKGVQETGLGQQAEQLALGKQGTQNIEQEQTYQGQQQKSLDSYNAFNSDLLTKRQHLAEDIQNGHVDPKRYLNSMSTGSKISSAIGLILGGIGSGLTHGPNLAFQYLTNQIDRDIDSQKNDLGKKENLLAMNFRETGDLRSAYEMTKIQNNDLLSSHLRQVADQTADPVAKARIMGIQGMIDTQSGQIQHNMSMQKAMMSGQGEGQEDQFKNRMQYLRMNGQEPMAKDLEAKHLPGVPGQASIEITPEVRKEWTHLSNLDKSYTDASTYLKNASQLGAGWQNANKARGTAIQQSLELEVGQLEGLGRFTPEEAKRYRKMIPDLTGTHITGQDSARLQQLQREVQNHKNTFLQNAGLNVPQQGSAPTGSPQTKTVNGITYTRGPNGEAVKVK